MEASDRQGQLDDDDVEVTVKDGRQAAWTVAVADQQVFTMPITRRRAQAHTYCLSRPLHG